MAGTGILAASEVLLRFRAAGELESASGDTAAFTHFCSLLQQRCLKFHSSFSFFLFFLFVVYALAV